MDVLGRTGDEIEALLRRASQPERDVILAGLEAEVDRERRATYRGSSLAAFAHDCIAWPAGMGLAPYQAEILEDVSMGGRVAVRGPHGLGKSTVAALAILGSAIGWDEAGEDWKIPVTASAWAQLTHFLWPEVHKWSRLLRWDRLGREQFQRGKELLVLQLKLEYGEVFSFSPDDAAKAEGAHAERLLLVVDEAKSVPPSIFTATEGAFAGAGPDTGRVASALAISTPGEPVGPFYEIHSRKPGYEDWRCRHVTLDEAINAGRISRTWAEARGRQWGVGSAIYKNRVLGEFATSEESGVIPLEWVEAANRRWLAMCQLDDHGRPDPTHWQPIDPFSCVGVDVARKGQDQTVMALRYGDAVAPLRYTRKEDTMETSGRVVGILQANTGGPAIVDDIGVGAGVTDRVKEVLGAGRVVAFIASAHSDATDRSGELHFKNLRSEALWKLRERLDPTFGALLALPPDDLLTGDLVTPHYKVLSGGVIQVESKDDIEKRIGRSPDSGDAVVMACHEQPHSHADFSGIDAMLA